MTKIELLETWAGVADPLRVLMGLAEPMPTLIARMAIPDRAAMSAQGSGAALEPN